VKILFATGNPGKLREVEARFAALGIEVEQLVDEYPEIQSDDLETVVDLGLDWLWERHKMAIIIDDSGLFINALGGFPGVFSAYVFKSLGCGGILKLMDGVKDRSAEFRCCAGFIGLDGKKIIVNGVAEGVIIHEKLGDSGFGYDPIFMPVGEKKTFAQMELDEKNSISHRGRAFAELAARLKEVTF